jgi:hypothetical protein
MREGEGFSWKLLSAEARKYPGRIDLFRLPDAFTINGHSGRYDRIAAAEYMLSMRDRRYGWLGILRLAVQKIPGLWAITGSNVADDTMANGGTAFCRHAVSDACQFGGGVDLVPGSPNCRVTPHDLYKSILVHYGYYATLSGE